MAYEGGTKGKRAAKLTSTNVTVLANGSDTMLIEDLYITEIAGGTPDLSLETYDGTSSFYLMKSKPMTARQPLHWSNIYLDKGDSLRVTAGTANQIDCFATVLERTP